MLSVIGCPRSATLWTYKVLRALYVDVAFEQEGGEWNSVDWHHVAVDHPQGAIILHQVREPLRTMSSMQTLSYPSWNYVANSGIVDIASASTLTLQVMRMWYFWNRVAEAKAQYTYCVEEIDKHWANICDLIGIGRKALPDISKDCNTRASRYVPLTWNNLQQCNAELCQNIKDLAMKYGYNAKG